MAKRLKPRLKRRAGGSAATGARQGIQSVERGAGVLRALAAAPAALALKDLARAAAMPASNAHRYLVSLSRAGLVERDEFGRYDLGGGALEVGLAALRRLDAVKVGAQALAELRRRVDETALLAVWANRGPTVIRWEESSQPVTVNVRVGSVMPVLSSATGRAFLAYMPAARTAGHVEAERERRRAQGIVAAIDTEGLIAETRARGLGRVDGDLLPGVAALAAPILDADGHAAAVLAALGPQGLFDASWDGPVAQALRATAAEASRRMGAG